MSNLNQTSNNFCMAPWMNIHVSTSGGLQPCCSGAGIRLGLDQLPVYPNNRELLSIKKQFNNNQVPSACQGCQEKNWYSQFKDRVSTDLDSFTPLSIDLRWSNTCQLTCMYCNSESSSSWAALESRAGVIPIDGRIRSRDHLFDFINEHKSTIERVSLLGGEPLLIKENLKVLELLGPDIEVNIFTGLNVDLENNRIFEILIGMPNVFWTISMENVGKKFEFVRRGTSWEKQLKNIDTLLSNTKSQYTCNLQSQFCVYSATSVTELYDFVTDKDIEINWSWLDNPQELNFIHFPDHYKFIALDQLKQVKDNANQTHHKYKPHVDHIIERLENSLGQGNDAQVSICREWHEKIEARYFGNHLDFKSLWPEFAKN